MLLLILKSHTDEGFGRNVYENVFFLSSFIYTYIYIYIGNKETINWILIVRMKNEREINK